MSKRHGYPQSMKLKRRPQTYIVRQSPGKINVKWFSQEQNKFTVVENSKYKEADCIKSVQSSLKSHSMWVNLNLRNLKTWFICQFFHYSPLMDQTIRSILIERTQRSFLKFWWIKPNDLPLTFKRLNPMIFSRVSIIIPSFCLLNCV